MTVQYPDYNNSILGLSASVLTHYGADCKHMTLPLLDKILSRNYKNVVLMLFDGMGSSSLREHLGPEDFLREHVVSEISSVFPPTTTAGTVSIESGLSPIEHGWLGWNLYFKELDANVSVFPNTVSTGAPAAEYHVANRYLPYKNILEKITVATDGEVETSWVSPFSNYRTQSSKELCDTVKEICQTSGRRYIYTYWHQPDYNMHGYGTKSKRVRADVQLLNLQVEEMCQSLKDTLVIVTADHGLVDTEFVLLAQYPEVETHLLRPPSIESRALSFYVKPGEHAEFERAFTAAFEGQYLLLSKDEVLGQNLFGYGEPHPRSLDFLGDYLAIAIGHISIDCSPATVHAVFKAAHAGMTEEEMTVPLIAIECGK